MQSIRRKSQLRIGRQASAWLLAVFCGLALSQQLGAQEQSRIARAPSAAQQPTRAPREALVLRFRRQPSCQSQVVRLGDLVEFASGSEHGYDDLLEVPLAPAPAVGAVQNWSANDVMRHLQLRGLTERQLRWSGPESASLTRLAEAAAAVDRTKMKPAFVQDRVLEQAAANVALATREYLWLQTGERTPWRISVEVPPEHATALAQRHNITTVSGGEAPWVGEQEMAFAYKYQGKKIEVSLPVLIELPVTVVVAARPLRRDEVIDESALEYAPLPERMADDAGQYFTDFSEIVGKQLRRSVSTGLPIAQGYIGEPIVVSSGELVEIESVAGSISVKTAARALSGGAVGELINVELLSSRARIAAMVVGPLQVRVAGGAPISRNSAAETAKSPRRSTGQTANRLSQETSLR